MISTRTRKLLNIVAASILQVLSASLTVQHSLAEGAPYRFQYTAEMPGCPVDGNIPAKALHINDTRVSPGVAYDAPGGNRIGEYRITGFSDSALAKAKFIVVGTESCTNLLFYNSKTGETVYLGRSWPHSLDTIDTSAIQWRGMAGFLLASSAELSADTIAYGSYPLLHAMDGDRPEGYKLFYVDVGARGVYATYFLKKVISALTSNSSLQLASGMSFPLATAYLYYPCITATDRASLILGLERIWPTLSKDNQALLLSAMAHGDGRTVRIAAKLLLDFLKKNPNDFVKVDGQTVGYIVFHADLSQEARDQIVAALAANSVLNLNTGQNILWFLNSLVQSGDGIILSKAMYNDLLNRTALGVLKLGRDTWGGVANEQTEFISTHPYHQLLPFYARYFPTLLTKGELIVSEKRNNQYREIARSAPLTELAQQERYLLDENWILKDSALLARLFDAVSSSLKEEAKSGSLESDDDVSVKATRIQRLVSVMKARNLFNDSRWIFPLLEAYNPPISGENRSQYAARLQTVKDLWTRRRVFVVDYFGGLRRGGFNISTPVSYANMADDFSILAQGQLDVVLLRTQGNTTAFPGTIAMNWRESEFQSPFEYSKVLFHEGGHAIDQSHKASSSCGVLCPYWYQDRFLEPSSAFVSGYSLLNREENYAELVSYWSMDGEDLLQRSISEYRAGKRQLLNQSLIFALSLTPRPGSLAAPWIMFSKLEANGRHSFRYEPAAWVRGRSILDGQLAFNLRGKGYTVTYKGGLITAIGETKMLPPIKLNS